MPILHSIGTANPPTSIAQSKIAEQVGSYLHLENDAQRKLNILYGRSGIDQRQTVVADFAEPEHSVFFKDGQFPGMQDRMELFSREVPKLAYQAVDNCLKNSLYTAQDITHVITCSSTGYYSPGLDIQIIEKYNLKRGVGRTCINNMGCCAAFNALSVADAIAQRNPSAVVLVVCVELTTLHFRQAAEWRDIVGYSLFGDGAAAALVSSPKAPGLKINDFFTVIAPDGGRDVSWYVKDDGFEVNLSTYVPQLVGDGIGSLVDSLLADNNLSREGLDVYAFHTGGRKILEACQQALHLTDEDMQYSYKVLKEHGNMSSPSILFVLKEIMDADILAEGKKVLGVAFGPGLALESMLLEGAPWD
jgi:predicted naringenin-chalcone synthase